MKGNSGQGSVPFLDADLALALKKAARIAKELGPPDPGIEGLRAHVRDVGRWWSDGGPSMADERYVEIPAGSVALTAKLYRPSIESHLPVYVYLHGGGFRLGGPESNARQLREISADWGGAVISLNYPHIPEAPFPAAVEAIAAAYRWLAQHGNTLGLDGSRMAYGGSSAGANVSSGAAIAIGGRTCGFLRAAALVVPVLDGNPNTPSMLRFRDGPHFPTRAETIATWRAYGGDRTIDRDPRADLLCADPALFPPTFIAAAELDVFHDGAVLMADRLREAGTAHKFQVYKGMTHLFFGYGRMVATARRCATDLAAFLTLTLPRIP